MHPIQALHDAPPIDEVQKLDGPDYVAVVVEWTDPDDDAITLTSGRPLRRELVLGRTLVTVLGALGAIALTTWGLRQLTPS